MGMPDTFFDVVKSEGEHVLSEDTCDLIASLAEEQNAVSMQKDKDLISFIVALKFSDLVGAQIGRVVHQRDAPKGGINQIVITLTLVFVGFEQGGWYGGNFQ